MNSQNSSSKNIRKQNELWMNKIENLHKSDELNERHAVKWILMLTSFGPFTFSKRHIMSTLTVYNTGINFGECAYVDRLLLCQWERFNNSQNRFDWFEWIQFTVWLCVFVCTRMKFHLSFSSRHKFSKMFMPSIRYIHIAYTHVLLFVWQVNGLNPFSTTTTTKYAHTHTYKYWRHFVLWQRKVDRAWERWREWTFWNNEKNTKEIETRATFYSI